MAKPLRIGVESGLPPISFQGPDGSPRGFAPEIIAGVARETGLSFQYVVESRAQTYRDFAAGRLDALADVRYSPARLKTMAFSVTMLQLQPALFVRAGAPPLHSLNELKALRFAGLTDNASYDYLEAHGLTSRFVAVASQAAALRAVADGRADAVLGALDLGLGTLRKEGITTVVGRPISLPGLELSFHVAVHPDEREALAAINEGLARMFADRSYDAIYERWIGSLAPRHLEWTDLRPYLPPALAVIAVALGIVLLQRRFMRRLSAQAAELRQSQEQLMRVLDGSNDGFWDWDIASGRVMRSARWSQMLDYEPGEIPDTREAARALVHPDDLPAFDSCQKVLEEGASDRYALEYRLRTKSGEWRWIRDRGKVVARGPDGKPWRMAGTHTDITGERLAAEERERLRLKMLETQKRESLGVLAGGVAHDFNNLLAGILINAQLVRTHGAPAEERLPLIEQAAHRAADLCRQMLAYAGRGRLVTENVEVPALIRETAQLLEASISKKARLRLQLEPDLPAVRADPSQLRQVVMNLVLNASDALGDAGGDIVIALRQARPGPAESGEWMQTFEVPEGPCLCIEVLDSGSGMDAATLPQIFDPFFSTKPTGRGLGLAAVLGIVRSHHGALAVKSAPGRGTRFRLFLPASRLKAAAAGSAPEAVGARAGDRGKVLLADDEPVVRASLAAWLRRTGFRPVEAEDGAAAVRRFQEDPDGYSAVVLDLTMPGMDGAQALRAIRALRPNAPVLLMSGYSSDDILARLGDQPPVEILSKPFTLQALLAAVNQVAVSRASRENAA